MNDNDLGRRKGRGGRGWRQLNKISTNRICDIFFEVRSERDEVCVSESNITFHICIQIFTYYTEFGDR